MANHRHLHVIPLTALILAGCATVETAEIASTPGERNSVASLRISGTIGSSEEDEQAAIAERLAAKVLMSTITGIEIGRTRDGVLITALGEAPGPGYSLAVLRPRRGSLVAPDGFIEFDFVASPPDPELDLGIGTPRTRAIRADLPLLQGQVRTARGLRIIARSGAASVAF